MAELTDTERKRKDAKIGEREWWESAADNQLSIDNF